MPARNVVRRPLGACRVTERTVPTLAQRFRDAVWEAGPEQLTTTETLILLAYADHARGTDTAWVAQSRLVQRCKLRSKGTPSRVLAGLVDKGWLELLSPAHWGNKQSPTYRLLIPTSPSDGEVDDSKPPRSKRQPPRSQTKPPRSVDQSSPSDGAKLPVNRVPLSSEGPSRPSGGDDPPRTASPRGEPSQEQNPADADGPSMTAEEARAQLRALLDGKRSARVSRWAPRHRGEATPNELFTGFPQPDGPVPAETESGGTAA